MNLENQKFFNEFFCSKTGKWKHVLVPSLQHVTMVKIAIDLWNQIDIKETIVNLKFNNSLRSDWKEWREIEVKALDKVAQLLIPEGLKKEFLGVISPIGLHIKKWWRFHKCEIGLLQLPNRFSWTPRGTIDRVKTAECLVKDKNINVDTRYKLACMYCMEDVIPEVWKQLDEDKKQYYYTIDETDQYKKRKFKFLLTFWAYHLKGETSQLNSSNWTHSLAFRNAILMGNKMAAECFFGKLTDEEKSGRLVIDTQRVAYFHTYWPFRSIPKEYYSELFLYLLTRISKAERETVLEKFPFKMLECLLEWPNRPLFVELAERTLRSIDDDQHHRKLMSLIIKDIANGWSDCTSRQLFHHFWNLCPLSYKRRAIEGIDYCTILKLYEGNEVRIIRALFQHACAVEKEGLIMCRRERDISSCDLLKKKGWEPLEEAVAKFRTEFWERSNE